MTEYAAGTVAVATVRGVPNVRVAYVDPTDASMPWMALTGVDADRWVYASEVTDVRPLIMLDLDGLYDGVDMGGWDYVVDILRQDVHASNTRNKIADQIEAQTKPPRIPEPTAFGAEVTAGQKGAPVPRRWIRAYSNPAIGSHPWADGNHLANWDDLLDPVLVRPGIEDES